MAKLSMFMFKENVAACNVVTADVHGNYDRVGASIFRRFFEMIAGRHSEFQGV